MRWSKEEFEKDIKKCIDIDINDMNISGIKPLKIVVNKEVSEFIKNEYKGIKVETDMNMLDYYNIWT